MCTRFSKYTALHTTLVAYKQNYDDDVAAAAAAEAQQTLSMMCTWVDARYLYADDNRIVQILRHMAQSAAPKKTAKHSRVSARGVRHRQLDDDGRTVHDLGTLIIFRGQPSETVPLLREL